MKMKKIFAAMAATAVSVSALAAMSINSSAAETTIPYTNNGTVANIDGLDGNSYRLNIYNIWGNDVKDIAAETAAVNQYISVTFTVSGLGEQSANKNEDGTDADSYFAYLGGACGTNPDHHNKPDAEDELTAINGDGQYTVKWNLTAPSESISCLYIQTNINAYNLPEGNNFAITVDSIATDDGVVDEPVETTTTEGAETTTSSAATTSGNATTTTTASGTTATTKAANGGSTESATQTGDAGVGIALGVVGLAAATAFVVRKRS